MRINKYIALTGRASRRGADELIQEGRIFVNNKIVKNLGIQIDPDKDKVELDGKQITVKEECEYWLVNKPRGVVSTVKDTHRRKTVVSLVKTAARLFPVGRLDAESEGLLLLTNDGELAYKLTHPKYEIEKTYEVKVMGKVDDLKVIKLSRGVRLEEGVTAPAVVEILGHNRLEFKIHEGRKRQIRRMCSKVGLEVVELRRIKMGSLSLGDLKTGEKRELTQTEVNELKKQVGE